MLIHPIICHTTQCTTFCVPPQHTIDETKNDGKIISDALPFTC